MAMPTLSVPAFPNVPQAPGVPQLLRSAGKVQNTVVTVVSDVLSILGMFAAPKWGLFLKGKPAIVAESVISVSFRKDNRISSAPQEQGGFNSYNKVARPFEAHITLNVGSSLSARTALLKSIMAAQASLTQFTLVTPEISYPGVNVVHHDYDRSQREGVGLLSVDVWVEEIRTTGTSQFTNSNTANTASQDPSNTGTVQPTDLSPANNPNVAPSTGGFDSLTKAQKDAVFNAPTGTTLTFPIGSSTAPAAGGLT